MLAVAALAASSQVQPSLRFSSVDGQLLANGKPFRIKGVTWWGAESARALPGGLEQRSLDEVLGLLAKFGFNAIKLPFLHQHVLFDEYVPAASFDPTKSPQLLEGGRPRKYVATLHEIARRAAAHGILVWLVAHSLEGLWYSRAISEATVLDSWNNLARQMCPQWNVAGVELKNRPWAASWGHGRPIDWDKAAGRLGNHVNSKCARWLIGVDGVGESPGAAQDPEMEFGAMFPDFQLGENLVGARKAPVELADHTRLVYAPHTYGPGVRRLPYMESEDFPENAMQVWDEHFLFLTKRAETRQPSALVLNLGGPYEALPRDRLWQDWAFQACAAKGLSFFYDGLNPHSGIGGESPYSPASMQSALVRPGGGAPTLNNTGGLFLPGWGGMHEAKLRALAQVPATRVATVLASSRPPPPPPPAYVRHAFTPYPPPPPRPPPPGGELPLSPPALALTAVILLAIIGQLGGFRKPCAPMRASGVGRSPALGLLWALLGVPAPAEAEAGLASVVPRGKRTAAADKAAADRGAAATGGGAGGGEEEEDEGGESSSLIAEPEHEEEDEEAGGGRARGGEARRTSRERSGGSKGAAAKGDKGSKRRGAESAGGGRPAEPGATGRTGSRTRGGGAAAAPAKNGKAGRRGGRATKVADDSSDEEHQPLARSAPPPRGDPSAGPAWED